MGLVAQLQNPLVPLETITIGEYQSGTDTWLDLGDATCLVAQMGTSQADFVPQWNRRPHDVMNQPYEYIVAYDAFVAGVQTPSLPMAKRGHRITRSDGQKLKVEHTYDVPTTIQILYCRVDRDTQEPAVVVVP